MAKDVIALDPIKISAEDIVISAAGAGFLFKSLAAQVSPPSGYRYAFTVATAGSTAGIRNNIAFIGLTANLASAVFYAKEAVAEGGITIQHYFFPLDKLEFLT